tara:strand:- start:3059 stop:3463 length:405 start_codon:yes stop_codon:yes gene_type:complete
MINNKYAAPPNLIDKPISQRNLKDEKIIKLASGAELDEGIEAEQFMREIYVKEIEAGNISNSTSYDEWILSLRQSLGDGGKVVDLAKYRKSKEPKIQTIDIGKYLNLGRTLSSLNQSERDTLKWILNKSLYKKD